MAGGAVTPGQGTALHVRAARVAAAIGQIISTLIRCRNPAGRGYARRVGATRSIISGGAARLPFVAIELK
ncbi:hypothetical protein [Frigidibacter sp. ROC022]|uniref:hypothetical protein n=1 Tax=Frigidibacter sp. ROC022 TaxID=2971796 RepID=UPI00215A18F1|nr:hypothetical protein [Frigidibacter sp. ROC022]MCR8723217.1 hypothetical protein [Frigidibacter sp. ROC022]